MRKVVSSKGRNFRCIRAFVLDSLRSASAVMSPIASLFLLAGLVTGQTNPVNPERGIVPGASYSISDIEVINTTNGNLILNIPLASLPKGRGEVGQSISLTYNSKLFDVTVEETLDQSQQDALQNFLHHSENGGWRYVTNEYRLDVISRFDPETPWYDCLGPDAGKNSYSMRVAMHMPDGSTKEFRPTGFNDNFDDGFFNVMPSGYNTSNCSGGSTLNTTGGMTYYSTDGSYMKLVVDYLSTPTFRGEGNPWTLYIADGSRIVNNGTTITKYDRNGNSITGFEDEFERSISLTTNVSTNPRVDEVTMEGVGGEELVWTITWKTVSGSNEYETTGVVDGPMRGGTSTQTLSSSLNVIDTITLPSQLGEDLTYTFEYNNEGSGTGWGELSKVTLPSGAEVDYLYTTPIQTNTDNVLRRYVSQKTLNYTDDYDGTTTARSDIWTYSLTKVQATITGPDGTVTIEKFGNTTYDHKDRGLVYSTSDDHGNISERIWDYQYPSAGGGAEDINAYVKTEFTTIADSTGSPSLTKIVDYSRDLNGNVTEVKEYDWVAYSSVPRSGGKPTGIPGGATLKRITSNVYNNSTSSSSSNGYWSASSPNIRNSLKSSTVSDGSSTPVPYAHTEFFYDNASTTGNLTQTRMWSTGTFSNPLSGSNYISTSTTYDSYGNPLQITDANGNITKYTYENVCAPETCVGLYPTQVETAYNTSVERTATTQYDFYTGLPISVTDEDNDATTTTDYDDVGRPELVKHAVGTSAETRIKTIYNSVDRYIIVKSDLNTVGDEKLVTITHFDQLGRVRLTRSLEDPVNENPEEEEDGIKVQTRYLNAENCTSSTIFGSSSVCSFRLTSNPYRANYSSNADDEDEMGWTLQQSRSDGLIAATQSFSGETLPVPFVSSGGNSDSSGTVLTYKDSDRSLVMDQAGKMRISRTNALGHLTEVWEVTGQDSETVAVSFPGVSGASYGYKTSYAFDPLNNLTAVNQGVQTRTFTYSPLSRLLSAVNPESGTIAYEYDAGGNLTEKTDARGVETSYTYDALNRIKTRTYDNEPGGQAATPDVTYTYDEESVSNSKGRLTKVTAERGSSDISETRYKKYDILGRIEESEQVTPVGTEDFTNAPVRTMKYKYNLAGALIDEEYPSTRVIKNTFDDIGRISLVQANKNSSSGLWTYANSFTFNAAGSVTRMQLGNGVWEGTAFNSRMQPTGIALGSTPGATNLLDLAYTYNTKNGSADNPDNNGNVLTQTIIVNDVGSNPGFDAVQTYTYDPLNRIKTAEEVIDESSPAAWTQEFTYDRYGNRNFNESTTTTLTKNCGTSPNFVMCDADREKENPEIDKDTNRIEELQPDGDQDEDYEFDAAGNTILDPDGRQFFYDGENKQISVEDISDNIIGEYVYDGDGRRVMKKVPLGGGNTETTVFVYDAGGKLVAEYSTTVASQSTAQVSYLTNDHLGSPRITTDKNGKVYSRRDFLPFGEDLDISVTAERTSAIGYGADSVRQKFTGYERDNETELDYAQARYMSFGFGRFTTPDPLQESARTYNPSSWNRYAYGLNCPLKYVDPTGLEVQFLNRFARSFILGGLPEEIRKQVESAIDKNGRLNKGALDAIESDDQNFLDLREIVNNEATLDITTGTGIVDANGKWEPFTFLSAEEVRDNTIAKLIAQEGLSREQAIETVNQIEQENERTGGDDVVAYLGQFQTAEETGGNARVTIAMRTGLSLPMTEADQVGTAGHETYGHGLLYFRNQPFGHGDQGAPPMSFFRAIEDRSKANFKGPQEINSPRAIKPKQR